MERIRVCSHKLLGRLRFDFLEFLHVFGTHDNKVVRDTALILQVLAEGGYVVTGLNHRW